MMFKPRFFSADRPRFEKLAAGPIPKVKFFPCSDSRVDPGALTVASAGVLFVIDNAGML